MADNKINEQLMLLRKRKGLTQEELAQIFGVTNQSVSKWESGACCPDISLIPDIANFFGVSIDTLFGNSSISNWDDTIQSIKYLFINTPSNESFDLAYKLSLYLHEGAISKGYKGYIPWDSNKERKSDEDFYKWGSSVCSEPDGVTIMKGNTVLITSHKHHYEIEQNDLMNIQSELQKYADIDRLSVFLALYELTYQKPNLFVNVQKIMDKTKIEEEKVREAFKYLPIYHKRLEDGSFGYRIEGSNMHIPSLLLLFLKY